MPSQSSRLKRHASSPSNEVDSPSSKRIYGTDTSVTVDDLQSQIVANLQQHATKATKDWFTNYVKGTSWIGCKLPTVRQCVNKVIPPTKKTKRAQKDSTPKEPLFSAELLLDTAVRLLEQDQCDVKLAGMLILSECFPSNGTFLLSSTVVLDRIEQSVLEPNLVNDWSSSDWFAVRVLKKIVLEAPEAMSDELVQRVLDYAQNGTNLWYRRCGIIPFVQYYNFREVLPSNIGQQLLQACEYSLLASPDERFTQTGVAWVLRYMLSRQTATHAERDAAAAMVVKHGSLWTTEAKKSLTEKLSTTDSLAAKIRKL